MNGLNEERYFCVIVSFLIRQSLGNRYYIFSHFHPIVFRTAKMLLPDKNTNRKYTHVNCILLISCVCSNFPILPFREYRLWIVRYSYWRQCMKVWSETWMEFLNEGFLYEVWSLCSETKMSARAEIWRGVPCTGRHLSLRT